MQLTAFKAVRKENSELCCLLLPCEWCQQSADAWCHRGSGRADMTSFHGPGPCGLPDTGWHPSAPSQGNYKTRNVKEEWCSTKKEQNTFKPYNIPKRNYCISELLWTFQLKSLKTTMRKFLEPLTGPGTPPGTSEAWTHWSDGWSAGTDRPLVHSLTHSSTYTSLQRAEH